MRILLIAYARCSHPGCLRDQRLEGVESAHHGESLLRLHGWKWRARSLKETREGWDCPEHAKENP